MTMNYSGVRDGGSIDSKPQSSRFDESEGRKENDRGEVEEAYRMNEEMDIVPVRTVSIPKDTVLSSPWSEERSSKGQEEEEEDDDLDLDLAEDDQELRSIVQKPSSAALKPKTWLEERAKITGNRGFVLSAKLKAMGFETDQHFCEFGEDEHVLRVCVSGPLF
jgi:hypothetical protein